MPETAPLLRRPLLIELGTEELPPKALDDLTAALVRGLTDGLGKRGIALTPSQAHGYNSPRRLAVLIDEVPVAQPDQTIERRGPAAAAGFDAQGQPTKALLGFAQSCGVDIASLEQVQTDKGAWFVFRSQQKGRAIADLLPAVLTEALAGLPIPKPMRWGAHDYTFVRPVHWLVLLHGDQVIDADVLGLRADRLSRGHRFHHPQTVWIPHASAYVATLRDARVLVDPVERRARIRAEVDMQASRIGGVVRVRPELLDEVANLVEWPSAVTCAFDADFLRVPQEALITTMEANQRFFPVLSAEGTLSESFIGIANIESSNPQEVRKGYERVIRPRFADARFFYDEDLKVPLDRHQGALAGVTYQAQLGSVWDKTLRVIDLARVIANRAREDGIEIDAAQAVRAAELSKCDLMTRMVGEFPELQGVMGRYYASAHGEPPAVADALDEFYAPRYAGDRIAGGRVGQVLAIAERLDTLAGIFAVGLQPSGNKDPFALRRAALGLARTLIEGDLSLDLRALLREALDQLPPIAAPTAKAGKSEHGPSKSAEAKTDAKLPTPLGKDAKIELEKNLYEFIIDRLRSYYVEQGIPQEAFEAVRALAPPDLADFNRRLRAVVAFAKLPEAQALAAANKRIGNILRQAGNPTASDIDRDALDAGAEHDLHAAVEQAQFDIASLIEAGRYVELLQRLAALRAPVDRFFDDVMVMAEDPAKRANRLALLGRLRGMFLRVADVSLLQTA